MLNEPFRRKPKGDTVHYEASYWSRLGVPAPSLFMPMFGPGRAEKVNNYSANGNDGTITSGAWTPSIAGMGLKFTGTAGQKVSLPSIAAAKSTLVCWVVPLNLTGLHAIASFGGLNSGTAIYTNNATFSLDPGNVNVAGSAAIAIGSVNMVAGVWNGATAYLYTNGRLDASKADTNKAIAGSGTWLANDPDRLDQYNYNGTILSALFLPYALTAAQVWKLYSQPWAMFSRRGAVLGGTAAVVSRPGFIIGGGVGFFPMAA